MTFPPSKIGDKGQRFEIRWRKTTDAPAIVRVLGWATKAGGAREMRDAWVDAPDVCSVWIFDRQTNKRFD